MSPAGGDLGALVDQRSVVICAGPGGVGKTTTAAALAYEAARRGRRAVVVTIDPARRLADALGLDALTNDPHQVPATWDGPGEMWALMLDVKTTFDSAVTRNAKSAAQAQAILDNRLYRNISGALSGTQEYMAVEKLYDLTLDPRFDLVVVDTPPTRHALDFLDAPARLLRFLNNRFFRVLMMPTRASLRAVNFATQTLLKTISRVVGGDVVRDAVAFFTAFEGMEQGFRDRAGKVEALLAAPGTAFVVVSAPRRDAVEESLFFARRLQESGQHVAALVVNRLFPNFGGVPAVTLSSKGETPADSDAARVLEELLVNARDLDAIARREEQYVGTLTRRVSGAVLARVPYLDDDVHDIDGLARVASYLFPQPGASAG
ncbi:AAA family ATPase [Acidiferrimicrobium sp. IK]|uniref:ArsA family ATPase n=1 Tax=Acidiferrimicrobium sp. IK TaxID=2871700 RepID=UPI0021CAFD41|nr:ArsA-related P-loop ATPase [Acidiferrimicrobium sp. IK]MCU4186222.1 AAA family ATPase [Acidiferrimicrobium sp. IK]